jgi:hypothetical protein
MQVELISAVHMVGVNKDKVTLSVKVKGLAIPALDVRVSVASAAVVAVGGSLNVEQTKWNQPTDFLLSLEERRSWTTGSF